MDFPSHDEKTSKRPRTTEPNYASAEQGPTLCLGAGHCPSDGRDGFNDPL